MADAAYFRDQANYCRQQARAANDRELIEQLLLLAEEYEAEAARLADETRVRLGGPRH